MKYSRRDLGLDEDHPCPICGSAWKFELEFLDVQGQPAARRLWRVVEGTGWCSISDCPGDELDRVAFRRERRERGWDPSE
jgi:hypothetical protein